MQYVHGMILERFVLLQCQVLVISPSAYLQKHLNNNSCEVNVADNDDVEMSE